MRHLQRYHRIKGEDLELVGQRTVHPRTRRRDAGIDHHDPDVEITNATDQFIHCTISKQVQRSHDIVGAMGLGEFSGQGLQPIFPARHQDDADARRAEMPCELLPDTRGRPGHHRVRAVCSAKVFHSGFLPAQKAIIGAVRTPPSVIALHHDGTWCHPAYCAL